MNKHTLLTMNIMQLFSSLNYVLTILEVKKQNMTNRTPGMSIFNSMPNNGNTGKFETFFYKISYEMSPFKCPLVWFNWIRLLPEIFNINATYQKNTTLLNI